MNCWHCNTELIWGADHDLDDDLRPAIMDGSYSMVPNLSCPEYMGGCGAFVEVYI